MSIIKNKLFCLIVIALLARASAGFFHLKRGVPDTEGYFRTAEQLISGDYTGYIGKRPPVYPLIIAAAGFNPEVIIWIQGIMGVGISVLLYLLFSTLTGKGTLGFLIGLSYAVNPSQIMCENFLVSETTCTFILTLSVYLFFKMTIRRVSSTWYELILFGLVCSLCVLTRAQYQFLPIIYAIFLGYHLKAGIGESVWKTAVFLIPVVILVGAWGLFQYKRIGQFTIAPELGYSLTNHTINFIEFAPDRYDNIKQVLIRNRQNKLQAKGETYVAYVTAVPELLELTKLSYAQLSQKLVEINLAAIKEKPLLYLKGVATGCIRFFKPFWPGRLYGIRPAISKGGILLKSIAAAYTFFQITLMLIFLIFPFLLMFSTSFRKEFVQSLEITFIYSLALGTGFLQALVELGENARYKTSVEPLMICMAIWAAFELIRRPSQSGKR